MITNDKIKELRELHKKAGVEWIADKTYVVVPVADSDGDVEPMAIGAMSSSVTAEVAVAARNALPSLLDEIERLRKLVRCETIQPPYDVGDDCTTELAVELAEANRKLKLLRKVVSCLHDKKGEWLGMYYVDDDKLMTAFNVAREGGALEG